jgi:hypothetical protein
MSPHSAGWSQAPEFTVMEDTQMRQFKFSTQVVSEDVSGDPYIACIIDYEVPTAEAPGMKIQMRPSALAVITYRGGKVTGRFEIPLEIIERLKDTATQMAGIDPFDPI